VLCHVILLKFVQLPEVSSYWDAAQELYENLPVLGDLMRWLRKSASASTTTKEPHAHRSSS
jgi:hypothetical protein